MCEIISGLWLDINNKKNDGEFMIKIDLPMDCYINNNICLSLDLETRQLKQKIPKIIDYIYKNLLNMKNILLYNSKINHLQNAEIILVAFLMKYTNIKRNKAIEIINNKLKRNLFHNNNYLMVLKN